MVLSEEVKMRFVIENNTCVFSMSGGNAAAVKVPDGSWLVFKTKDCFGNQVRSADMEFQSLDWDNINPATGPVYVEGAEPGDTLRIRIRDIAVGDRCTMMAGPGLGLSGDLVKKNEVRIVPVRNGFVEYSPQVKVPVRPMIGVIGVAPVPEAGEINCGTPGEHGGNMDCKEITAGADLYLRVNVPGALLAMGDLHAAMGDGEVSVCGAEIPGEVTVEVNVLKNAALPSPLLVTEKMVATIASAKTLEEAAELATHDAVRLLETRSGLSAYDAISLLSLAGNLAICQVVDPLKTVRMEMPKTIFGHLQF